MAHNEVEIRGPLSKSEFARINSVMRKEGRFLRKGSRLSLMYFRDLIPKDVRQIKDDKVDLRLRITNGSSEVVMKYGAFGGTDARKEYSFPLDTKRFCDMIEFLRNLGWSRCVVYANVMETYKHEGIEFTLVTIDGFGHVYEAEILSDEGGVGKAMKKIRAVCASLGLREYKEGEFEEQCNTINNTKGLQYNFLKDDPKRILERFNKYFKP